ncbi:MAG: hypothetical protein ACI89X_000279 [Planctomycetota bacterium]|jgi:uncharacterized protein YqjF (DUF2071 family)
MSHPALKTLAHRPWPIPDRQWSLTMRWEELLFLHWPVDPDLIRPHLPDDLELDTFDGKAWLGVVPFLMAATRFRWLPPVPTAYRFAECNLRTYVRHKTDRAHDGRPGVWFFSLDALSRLAVAGARVGFGLPYFYADMSCQQVDGRTHFKSARRDRRGPDATFEATWRTTGEAQIAAAESFEYFLAERYCLYAQHRGHLVCGEIAHQPWQLAPVDLDLQANDMFQLLNLQLPGPPVSALAAKPLDVAGWSPVR